MEHTISKSKNNAKIKGIFRTSCILRERVLPMSKYQPLWDYIKTHDQDIYDLSFDDIARILGFEIDHAFLTYKKELLAYGYEVGKISLKNKRLTIHCLSK